MLNAAILWFFGVVVVGDFTVLPATITAVLVINGVPPDVLGSVIRLWLNFSLVIACAPGLLMLIGVDDNRLVQKCAEMGKGMLLWGNPVGWTILAWTWLLDWSRKDREKPSPLFWIVLSVIVPSRYPKVPPIQSKDD